MATDFVKKWQIPHFCRMAFRNGMGYRDLKCALTAQMMPLYRVKIS